MKKFKLTTVSAIVAVLLLAVVFISYQKTKKQTEAKKDWYLTGYINPKNNREFIVNDSIVIKSGDFVTLMTVFCNGVKTKSYVFQHIMKNDAELIRHLQWQYEYLNKDEKIYKHALAGGFELGSGN